MRRTAEKIGLSDTFFLRRSSEKRYEFIRYTETYQFTELHAPLSASSHARQSELKSGKSGLPKKKQKKKLCWDFEYQNAAAHFWVGIFLNAITHEQRWIGCHLFGSSLMRFWILVWVKIPIMSSGGSPIQAQLLFKRVSNVPPASRQLVCPRCSLHLSPGFSECETPHRWAGEGVSAKAKKSTEKMDGLLWEQARIWKE